MELMKAIHIAQVAKQADRCRSFYQLRLCSSHNNPNREILNKQKKEAKEKKYVKT